VSSSVPAGVIVLTTLGRDVDAAAFARTLVDEQLAACVNILPGITSVYRWQGNVEHDSEQLLIIKTTPAMVDLLRERFATLHPYEVPEFLVLPVSGGSGAYLRWLADAVSRR
jgi:periplasmic divalent cation tolerance protein